MIGPPGPDGSYSNANGSIAGNGPHNPFLSSLTWSFKLIPVTGDTGPITRVNFSFLGNGQATTIAGRDGGPWSDCWCWSPWPAVGRRQHAHRLVATAAEIRLSLRRNPLTSVAAHSDCRSNRNPPSIGST
jgi:hypothetical protein